MCEFSNKCPISAIMLWEDAFSNNTHEERMYVDLNGLYFSL